MSRRGKFFTGLDGLVIYLTRPGYFYALEAAGPRELSDAEAEALMREELLSPPFEIAAIAVAAERLDMVRPLHPAVDPDALTVEEVVEADRQRVSRD